MKDNPLVSGLDELSLTLLSLENVLKELAIGTDVPIPVLEKVEQQTRDLRLVTNGLWSAQVTSHSYSFEDLGIRAYSGDGYIEIEFPYELVTKTTMFRVFSKRLAAVPSLVNVSTAWHFLMQQVLAGYSSFPFHAPIQRAQVRVTILAPDRRLRDPDHFWFRPILDSLTYARVLIDDNFDRLRLSFEYGWDRVVPAVILQVSEDDFELPYARSSSRRLVRAV